MRLPGFAAEASLRSVAGHYRPAAVTAHGVAAEAVVAQLSVNQFPGASSGWLDTVGSWVCAFLCRLAYSSCLNDCEGTIANPKPSMNCVICDQTYADCVKGCSGPAKA